jgi:hypothetical protein
MLPSQTSFGACCPGFDDFDLSSFLVEALGTGPSFLISTCGKPDLVLGGGNCHYGGNLVFFLVKGSLILLCE